MRNRIIGAAAIVALASSVFVGPAQASETITAGGATYTAALQAVCTQAFTDHKVTYTPTGSSGGKSGFRTGTMDFGGTDSLYAKTEVKPSKFVYVPILGGPVTLAYNLPGVTRLNLTPKIVADIYEGRITKWNDKALVAINNTAKLPDLAIVPVYRSEGSGTTFNFVNYLFQKKVGSFKPTDNFINSTKVTAGAIGSRGNSLVAATVKSTEGGIGYIDIADADKNNLTYAHLENGAKQFIKPTVANSKLFIEKAALKSDGSVIFDYNKIVRGAYDLSLVSYAVAPTAAGTAKADAVREYIDYFVNTCSPKNAAKEGYVALSGPFLRKANELIRKID